MLSSPGPLALVNSHTVIPAGITLGSATRAMTVVRLGKWVEIQMFLTTSGSTNSGRLGLTSPVPLEATVAHRNNTNNWYRDASVPLVGRGVADATAQAIIADCVSCSSNITYTNNTQTSSTVPFTWAATSDQWGLATGMLAQV